MQYFIVRFLLNELLLLSFYTQTANPIRAIQKLSHFTHASFDVIKGQIYKMPRGMYTCYRTDAKAFL